MLKMRLLNPGPVTLTERVRAALQREDLCHREPEFSALQEDIRERLTRVYPEAAEDYATVLLTGSGTAAVETMVSSLVPRYGKALVAVNGIYGERASAMLAAQGKPVDTVQTGWTDPIDFAEIDRRLSRAHDYTHVVAVHHETTTGRLNDMHRLGRICKERGVPLLLDAVSSFGGEELCFEEWNLEAAASCANKCLHGAPGLSFVLVRKAALRGQSGATSVYLDLWRHYREQEQGASPFTQAVHVAYALCEALREMEEAGGWRLRREHYRALSQRVRDGLAAMGVGLLLKAPEASSAVLTSFTQLPGVAYAYLHDRLKEAGFVIYAGQGGGGGEFFRIAVMGELTLDDIDELLEACRAVMEPGTTAAVPDVSVS